MDIAIVEDEPLVQERIERLCREILGQRIGKLNSFHNLDDAEAHLAENPVDLLLLDLNLHGKNGFDLLRTTAATAYHTVVISANTDRAMEAFDFGVIDFVAKPFSRERLGLALERILDNRERAHYGCRHLGVKTRSGIEMIPVADIDYLKADGHYTQIHRKDGSEQLHSKSIEQIAQLLPPQFQRIHRSYIANMNRVHCLQIAAGGSYQAQMISEALLPIARSRFSEIRQELEDRKFDQGSTD